MKHLLLSALSLCALLCAQPSFAQTKSPNMHSSSYALDWIATGEISGGAMTSPSYHMSATIGQMGANTRSASAGYKLANGFQSVMADAPKHSRRYKK